MKDENYLVINGYMIKQLHLKGNELLLYGLINGFSQDGESSFSGSLNYMAEWLCVSKQTILTTLKSLMDKGLIEKKEVFKSNIKFCEYKVLNGSQEIRPPVKNFEWGSQKIRPNNIYINNNNNIYNNNELQSNNEKINTFLSILKEDWYLLLKDWVEYRKSIKKPLKDVSYIPCYEKLVELSRDDIVIAQKIVEQSKANGWQGLFELKQAKQFYSPKSKTDKGEQAMDNIRSMFEEGMKERW